MDIGSTAADPVQLLLGSPLFEATFYAHQAERDGTEAELAAHYLHTGEAAFLAPSPGFDPRFYRDYNPDVAQHGMSPLLHYLQHGMGEKRYRSRAQLLGDARRLAASRLFDSRIFAWNRGHPPLPGLSDIEDYLFARDPAMAIGDKFDSTLYATLYPDWSRDHGLPVMHYIAVGQAQYRIANRRDLTKRRDVMRPRFNERYYLSQLPVDSPVSDPLEHYIVDGSLRGLDPAPDFTADYYLRYYTDIAGIDPFYHYAAHGHGEGRIGRPDFAPILSEGKVAYDIAKPTILVTSHAASRSGAPLVGLNIGSRLASTHNVVCYLREGGVLLEDFRAHSCLMVVCGISPLDAEYLLRELKQSHRLGAVLLNSVETGVFAAAALHAGLPSVALVHEFAEYTLPEGRMTGVVESADVVVAPADLVRDSLQKELAATRLGPANNIVVRPQGFLPRLPDDPLGTDLTREEIRTLAGMSADHRIPVVLGAGSVCMRKGVDLFVQTAAEVRRLHGEDFRFIWVGERWNPTTDDVYALWVAEMVRRMDLDEQVVFLPPQSNLDTLFALSDVFFVPSRLDPFPNVLLDGLRAGRAVVCFDRATGAASLFHDPPRAVGAAVPYCDVAAAAAALVRAFDPAETQRAQSNEAAAQLHFAFADYMEYLTAQLEAAHVSQAAIAAETTRIEASGKFDTSFHDGLAAVGTQQARRAIRTYVARSSKGLLMFSPRPGFNEGLARTIAETAAGMDLDGHAWTGGPTLGADAVPATTHRCITIEDDQTAPPFAGRIVIHLHLHYPELAAGMIADIVAAGGAADLIVTTTSEANRVEVAHALRHYKAGSVTVMVGPNRGRNFGPLLTVVGQVVREGGYDLVGHLHGKRSAAIDTAMGDRWRNFLTAGLLGGRNGLAATLAPFSNAATLGLLFPEDRHLVGWTWNRDIAASLAARMKPAPVLAEWPVFPLGAMFWARPAALAPLWDLDLQPDDFPAEPAPGDGTILHAIERMLPAICEAAGLTWATLHRKGAFW